MLVSLPFCYPTMSRRDPRAEAEAYLERHRVRKIFEELGTSLVFARPENPREFLMQEVRRLKECRRKGTSVRCLNFPLHEFLASVQNITSFMHLLALLRRWPSRSNRSPSLRF